MGERKRERDIYTEKEQGKYREKGKEGYENQHNKG